MQDFQRKKDSFLLFNNISQRDNSIIISSEQSKNLYDFVLKNDSQIKRMENDIINIKSQLLDLKMKFPNNLESTDINSNNINNFQKLDENNMNNNSYLNKILQVKEDIKNDIMKDINNILIAQKNEIKENFENFKQEIELYNEEKNNNNKFEEIGENLEALNQQLLKKEEEKSNFENIILN